MTFFILGAQDMHRHSDFFIAIFKSFFLAAIIYRFEPISESSDLSTVFRTHLGENIEMLLGRTSEKVLNSMV